MRQVLSDIRYYTKVFLRTLAWVIGRTLAWVIGGTALIAALLWVVLFGIARPVCVNQAEVIGVEYEWRILGGCFFDIDGQWIPADNYRGNVDLGA